MTDIDYFLVELKRPEIIICIVCLILCLVMKILSSILEFISDKNSEKFMKQSAEIKKTIS